MSDQTRRDLAEAIPALEAAIAAELAAAIETLNVPDDASSLTDQEDQS